MQSLCVRAVWLETSASPVGYLDYCALVENCMANQRACKSCAVVRSWVKQGKVISDPESMAITPCLSERGKREPVQRNPDKKSEDMELPSTAEA